MPTNPETDFDGCNRECRKAGAHTLRWGGCERAAQPEPTVSMSKIYTDPEDGYPSIGFDSYTVASLADLVAPALLMPEEGFAPPYSESYARALAIVVAKAIVHRNDPAAAPAVVSSPPATDRATLLLWAADQIDAETRQAKADGVLEPDKYRPCRDAAAQLRALAGCQECASGVEHSTHCPTPESHNWGCGCPSDVAAAIASCPGYEMSPSPCRCPCYGCKHHCGAHNPAGLRRMADEAQRSEGECPQCGDAGACAGGPCPLLPAVGARQPDTEKPKRPPMDPVRILGIGAERLDPTQCSGEEGFCPEHDFHRHSLKQPAGGAGGVADETGEADRG